MRIGIDINEANTTNRVGSNQFAFEILKALYELVDEDTFVLYSSANLVEDLPKPKKNWQYKIIPPAKLWTQWRLPLELIKDRQQLDVFFTPGHYAPRFCPVPSVVTIMDLAFLFMPDQFKTKDYLQLKNWTSYSIKQARKVIAISQNTKRDILNQYQKNDQDVIVAYPGYTPPKKTNQATITITKPYILFVGTIQPRKNIQRLVKAFELISEDLELVLAGKQGWLSDDIYQTIANSDKKNAIRLLGYTKAEELPSLYKNSLCAVSPGTYEGFGIPTLEAITHGTIPVVSNAGSLPEVVGENGIVFDPYSIESICDALKRAIQLTKSDREKMLRVLKKHSAIFSWKDSAKKIKEVLHAVSIS